MRRFLTIPACPRAWQRFDLYIIRDEGTAFYVGQSECAFERVWDHIKSGVHGHSIPGRFILANWPKSGSFTIELLSSTAERFTTGSLLLDFQQQRNLAERALINACSPCFNVALNGQPISIPPQYVPPNAPLKRVRSFRRMLNEARVAVQIEDNQRGWE